jgi:intracellular sulfur oxidation DsrE/DsrF family protein
MVLKLKLDKARRTMKLRILLIELVALHCASVTVAQDAAVRQSYVREEAARNMAGNIPPGYNISTDGPESTFYVLHQHGVTFPLCNNTMSAHGFVANLQKRGFAYFICTDDGSTKFTFDLAKRLLVGSESSALVPVGPPEQRGSLQEDFPLRFTIIEGHVTSTPKCWMTIKNEGNGVTYVVEQVTLFGCVLFDPGQTGVKGKRDRQWFDLVGTDKKGKVKVTRWEIKQQAM